MNSTRLCTAEEFDKLPGQNAPEVQKVDLTQTLLQVRDRNTSACATKQMFALKLNVVFWHFAA